MNPNEMQVIVCFAVILIGWLVVRSFKASLAKPVPPDPWGPEITEAMEQPGAMPLCPNCLCPHEPGRWFCPECGRSVGDYNNFNPYLYIFSLGEVLRAGTSGRISRPWLTVPGFILLSLVEYAVFAPIYWFLLFRNMMQKPQADAANNQNNTGGGTKSVASETSEL